MFVPIFEFFFFGTPLGVVAASLSPSSFSSLNDTVTTRPQNTIRENRIGLQHGQFDSIIEIDRCGTRTEDDEDEFLPSKVTPAPSAAAIDRDDDNDAENDVVVAVLTDTNKKRKSDHQSRNIPPKKKPKRNIQDNNNRNNTNVDDDDTDDGIHGHDDGDDDSDKTNYHPRRNDRRAAAKGKKKYIDDDNDDDDDDDSEASSHDYEEEESVVASKKRSRSSKFRSSSRRSSFASSSSSSSSSSSTYDDNPTHRSKRFQAEGEREDERKQEEYEARPSQPEEGNLSTRVGTKKRTGIAQVTPSPRPPQLTHLRVTMSPPAPRKSITSHRTSSRVATSISAAAQTIKKKKCNDSGS